jgi:ribose 5-phosphate isomerase B
MIIPIASDHAGFAAKTEVKKILESMDYLTLDFGTHSEDSVDYPDYAVQVASAVSSGEYPKGILICGSGQGVCMTANKFNHVRAALVWNAEIARMSVQHNNANILCLPGRYLSVDELKAILESWLSAHFEGGRHERRVEKISTLTSNNA